LAFLARQANKERRSRTDCRKPRFEPINSAWNEDLIDVTTADLNEHRDEDEPVSTRNSDEGDRPLGDPQVPRFPLANKFLAVLGSRDSLSLARENHLDGLLSPLSDSVSDRDLEDRFFAEPRDEPRSYKLARPFGGLFHLGLRHSPLHAFELEELEEVRVKVEPGLEEIAESDKDLLSDFRLSDFNVNRATPDHLVAPIIAIRAPTPDRKVLAEARPFPSPPPFGDQHRSAFVRPVPTFGRRRNRRRNQHFAGPRARHARPRKYWEIGYGTRRLQVTNQVLWASLSAIFIIVAGVVTSNNSNICVVFLYLLLAFGGFMTVIFMKK
jgi:hypothetical protein